MKQFTHMLIDSENNCKLQKNLKKYIASQHRAHSIYYANVQNNKPSHIEHPKLILEIFILLQFHIMVTQ